MTAPASPSVTDYPGNLYVVAAPSGTGKSSLVKALMELDSRVSPSVSHTTRAPRGQEKDGREYHFVDDATFEAMVSQDAFLECLVMCSRMRGSALRNSSLTRKLRSKKRLLTERISKPMPTKASSPGWVFCVAGDWQLA